MFPMVTKMENSEDKIVWTKRIEVFNSYIWRPPWAAGGDCTSNRNGQEVERIGSENIGRWVGNVIERNKRKLPWSWTVVD